MTAVLDAGIGGLCVLKALLKAFPKTGFMYMADQKHFPYGDKSSSYMQTLLKENVAFLAHHGAQQVVLACNTASTVLEEKTSYPIPVLGVISASLKQAQKESSSGKVGLLATRGTVRSQAFLKQAQKEHLDLKIYQQACPLLAPFLEQEEVYQLFSAKTYQDLTQPLSHRVLNQTGTGQAESAPRVLPFEKGAALEVFPSYKVDMKHKFLNKTSIPSGQVSPTAQKLFSLLDLYVPPLLDKGVDTIIMGCTHYLYLKPFIETYLKEGQKAVGPLENIIQEIKALSKKGWKLFPTPPALKKTEGIGSLLKDPPVSFLVSGSHQEEYKKKCQKILRI